LAKAALEELRALATPLAQRMMAAKRQLHEAQAELLDLLRRKPLMCSVMARIQARRTLGERCRSPLRPRSN
jgi:dihydrodipicolinate synthase/N-acetylneuraminate lyase